MVSRKVRDGVCCSAVEGRSFVSHTMTCWKEIARYLGKGVRTVQRWEQ
jgi:hypothetical protein